MAYPSTTVRARPDLAASFMEFDYAASQAGFVGQQVFPVMEVAEKKGTFGRVPVEELLLKTPDLKRAPRSGYARDDIKFTDDSWDTVEYGWEEPVDANEAAAYRNYFDHEMLATQRATNVLLTGFEERVAAIAFNTTIFADGTFGDAVAAGDQVTPAQWDTASPIEYFEAAVQGVYDNSGIIPDTVVMNWKVFRGLKRTKQIRDAIASSGAGSSEAFGRITVQQLAEVLGIPNVIVAGGTHNNAARNAAADPSQIWGNHALVFKRTNTQDLREVGLGRTFHWGEDDSMPNGFVESYEEPQIRSEIIRVRHQVHEKLLYKEVGWLIQGLLP